MKRNFGFTIVELLVVIAVIGVLAAITVVSYTGINAKANTASAQSDAGSAMSKINLYATDMATIAPTSYGSLTGADTTKSYFLNPSGIRFSTESGNTVMAAAPASNDTLDFSLCGTSGTATAPTTYSAITVPTGVKIGYWNQTLNSLNTSNTIGAVSGNYLTFPIACIKVGIAEATIAVAKALYNENSSTWPVTAAAINANTATGAKMPGGVTAILVNPTGTNGAYQVKFECGTAVASTLPCNNTGGRITYWTGSTTAALTYGSATNFAVPAS